MRVLVGYDGSECAGAAIDDLQRSGLPREVTAAVVSVGELLLPVPSPSDSAIIERAVSRRVTAALVQARAEAQAALQGATALAREGCRRVSVHFPQWRVHAEPVLGAPAEALIERAEDWHADLIVLGSHGRSALGRLVLGSVSKQVAAEACCSVRVARHVVDRRCTPPRIIIGIGIDGSRSSEAAVRAVASRAWWGGTEARIVAVDRGAVARAMLAEAANQLLAARLFVSTRVKEGDLQNALRDEAQAWQADGIFIGAHGFDSRIEPTRTASVAAALVSGAPCPVEIVRAAG